MAISSLTPITLAAEGDAAPRLLRKAGVPFQRHLDRSARWLFPTARLVDVVKAATVMRIDLEVPVELRGAQLWMDVA